MRQRLIVIGTLVSLGCAVLEQKAQKDAEKAEEYILRNFEEAVRRKTENLYEEFKDRMDPDVYEWFRRNR